MAAIQNHIHMAEAANSGTSGLVGVCYGTNGSNIPDLPRTIPLLKKIGIKRIRITEILHRTDRLEGRILNSSDLHLIIDVDNSLLSSIANTDYFGTDWINFTSNILDRVTHIVVGVNAIPGPNAKYIAPAMQKLRQALVDKNLQNVIKLTTLVDASVLNTTFPPSAAGFKKELQSDMVSILYRIGFWGKSPLLLSVFPYYDYAAGKITQDFATFGTHKPVYFDGEYGYWNMYDVLVDSFVVAIEKVGFTDVTDVMIGETGWPSAGNGQFTTPTLAAKYNQNFIRHITAGHGTPRNPKMFFDGFIYSMYNEQLRGEGVEQHFGLFYPNQQPVYQFYIPKNPNSTISK